MSALGRQEGEKKTETIMSMAETNLLVPFCDVLVDDGEVCVHLA
jgi:hypothetical protein